MACEDFKNLKEKKIPTEFNTVYMILKNIIPLL